MEKPQVGHLPGVTRTGVSNTPSNAVLILSRACVYCSVTSEKQ